MKRSGSNCPGLSGDHLKPGDTSERKLVMNMSSGLGSIHNNQRGSSVAYRASKAAVNMLNAGLAKEWGDVICIAMAPGWCVTELGGVDAEIAPEDSVAAQLETFEKLTQEDSGRFIDRFGATVPY